jgi:heterodisulfide reductase subunit A-like polyferredoxin
MRTYIDKGLCTCCGLCVKVCGYDVFVDDFGDVIALRPESCVKCGSCLEECPNQAISLCGYSGD